MIAGFARSGFAAYRRQRQTLRSFKSALIELARREAAFFNGGQPLYRRSVAGFQFAFGAGEAPCGYCSFWR